MNYGSEDTPPCHGRSTRVFFRTRKKHVWLLVGAALLGVALTTPERTLDAAPLVLEDSKEILGLPSNDPPANAYSPQKTRSVPKARNISSPVTAESNTAQYSSPPPSSKGDAAGAALLNAEGTLELPQENVAPDVTLEFHEIVNTDPVEQEEPATPADSPPVAASTAQTDSKPKIINLFGYVEFRSPLKNTPKWERVLKEEKKNPSFDLSKNNFPADTAKRWAQLRNKLIEASLMEKMKGVNAFFNQWPYKIDLVAWGLEDYWATPREFVRKSGDCEDYAISKYYALRDLGVPASQMRVVALIERLRNIGHAVLVVFVDDKAYVLDNLSNLILQHNRLPHYEPKFSVNEEYRWVHVKPMNKPKAKAP